jgi:hypothetical protein
VTGHASAVSQNGSIFADRLLLAVCVAAVVYPAVAVVTLFPSLALAVAALGLDFVVPRVLMVGRWRTGRRHIGRGVDSAVAHSGGARVATKESSGHEH